MKDIKAFISIDRALYHTPLEKIYQKAAELRVKGLEIQLEHPELWKLYPDRVVKYLIDLSSSYNFSFTIHSPIKDLNISSYNKAIRRASLEELKRTLDIGNALNVDYILMHLGKNSFVSQSQMSRNYKKTAISHSINAINELIQYCPGVVLTIENMTWSEWRLSSKIKFLEVFYQNVPDSVKFTLDIQHAQERSDVYVLRFYERFKDRLISIHFGNVSKQKRFLKKFLENSTGQYFILEPHSLPLSAKQEHIFPLIEENIGKLMQLSM
ncbi:MAG: TIM barrel protein [Candidatus Helarchaeota archaeon]